MSIGRNLRFPFLAILCSLLVAGWCVTPATASAPPPDRRAEFLRLCDEHAKLVEEQTRTKKGGRQFYVDSYVVRALCVAYDMTGKQDYLDVCKRWSDRMIDDQGRMIPKNAYYMNYGRAPGQEKGNWYVADCSSIAMGVLATAVRCDDPTEKARYLDSVKSFADLVIDNWVRPSGGVANGHWPKSDKEWWCSTGVFGSLAFLLHDATGEERYRKIGLRAIDWLNGIDFLTVAVHYPSTQIKPTVMMYCLEAYSGALRHLEPGSPRYKAAMAQWAVAFDWMAQHQGGRAGVDYAHQWGSKLGGLPCHMYVYAAHVPGSDKLVQAADREVGHIADLLKKLPASAGRNQLAAFVMMAYAEKLSPGTLYRSGGKPVR